MHLLAQEPTKYFENMAHFMCFKYRSDLKMLLGKVVQLDNLQICFEIIFSVSKVIFHLVN